MIRSLLNSLRLPSTVTPFERAYLARAHRVALAFVALHIPVFMLVAWANGTGPLLALALCSLAVIGPTVAMSSGQSPRMVSHVFAVVAMYVGALLVHFGRGLWTIEMHFYFFVGLVLLAVFGNPITVLVGAVTVTLHHALFWAVLPESVFNYDAPLSSVAVHAAFVVVASTGSCYMSRTFYDAMIGLDATVQERTSALHGRNRDLQFVLDNVDQGFLNVQSDGTLSAEHSKPIRSWFGVPKPGQTLWALLGTADPGFGVWLKLGWDALIDGFLPPELALEQLPRQLRLGQRLLEVQYRPVTDEQGREQYLVVLTDISERVARENADLLQREAVGVFQRILRDRSAFLQFFEEVSGLVDGLADERPALSSSEAARRIHTIKGNCALFGVTSVATVCNDVEQRLRDEGEAPGAADRAQIVAAWKLASDRLLTLLGGRSNTLHIEEAEYLAVIQAIRSRRPTAEVERLLLRWRHEPVHRRFDRLEELARSLAERFGILDFEVRVESGGVRVDRDRLQAFWSVLVHVVRNALDHGLSGSGGKPRLDLRAVPSEAGLDITVADNGRGIAWEKVREVAASRGLASSTRDDLVMALFADGVTTCSEATDVSGLGLGLPAVRGTCAEMGIGVTVTSAPGQGTSVQFFIPAEVAWGASADGSMEAVG